MDSQVNYAIVGLVVLLLTALLIASVLWLAFGSDAQQYDRYMIRVAEESVAGVNKKALVKYHGVDVGSVGDIQLDLERPNEVHLLLDIQRGTPLTQDTKATLTMQGMTGLVYIELSGGKPDSQPLQPKPAPHYTEIPTNASLFFQFDKVFRELSEDVARMTGIAENTLADIHQITASASAFVSQKNVQAVETTLQHILSVSSQFSKSNGGFGDSLAAAQRILLNLEKTTQHLPSIAQQVDKSLLNVNNTVLALGKTASQVNGLLEAQDQSIRKTLNNMAKTSQSLQRTMQQGQRDFNQFTQQALPSLTASLREMQDLLQTLRMVSGDLKRKPNMLLLGKPRPARGPGE